MTQAVWTYSAPQTVTFAVTARCNLRCVHCLSTDDPEQGLDLDQAQIFGIIDQLREARVLSVSVFGGEPFARPDIREVLDYLYASKFGLNINTNAVLVPNFVDFLAERPRLGYTVSLDGSKPEVVDAIRGRGTFKATIEGLKLLRKMTENIVASVTVMRENAREVRPLMELCRSLGLTQVRFNAVAYVGNAACEVEEVALSSPELSRLMTELYEVRQEYGPGVSGALVQMAEAAHATDRNAPCENLFTVDPCGAGTSKIAIRPDGIVTPCELMWSVACGDLKEQRLKEIWEKSTVFAELRSPMTVRLDDECAACRNARICYYGHRCVPYHYPEAQRDKQYFCLLGKAN